MVIEECSDRSKPAEHNDHKSLQRETRYKVIWRECFAAGTAVLRFFFFVASLLLSFLSFSSGCFFPSIFQAVSCDIYKPTTKLEERNRKKQMKSKGGKRGERKVII